MAEVAIINYGMGNLASVVNALTMLGAKPQVIDDPGSLSAAKGILLPGVGAFAQGMYNLRERGWDVALREAVQKRKQPFLGICLGMQLLASEGTEHGICAGLDFISGRVELLSGAAGVRIPHIGWNDTRIVRGDGIFGDMRTTEDFYYVHSYTFRPADTGVISAICDYGGEFVAGIESGNIAAVQFHPEKSHKAGLILLKNWLAQVASC